jgi:hypothetical protein
MSAINIPVDSPFSARANIVISLSSGGIEFPSRSSILTISVVTDLIVESSLTKAVNLNRGELSENVEWPKPTSKGFTELKVGLSGTL